MLCLQRLERQKMSFSTNDILNSGGPGSSAEPSMEEILASIRRILKEDDTVKAAPVDLDDDVLVLDQSMLARPADTGAVTYMPVEPPPPEPPAMPLQSSPEPLHFSSEATPFAEDYIPAPQAPAAYEPLIAVPPPAPPPAYEPAAYQQPAPLMETAREPAAPEPAAPEPAAAEPVAYGAAAYQSVVPAPPVYQAFIAEAPPPLPAAPLQAAPLPAAFKVPEPAPQPAAPLQAAPLQAAPEPAQAQTAPPAAAVSYPPPPAPILPEPPQLEEKMPNAQESVEPPHSIISDKTTDAAASSIGALVRSMTMEKSVAVSRHGVTIEDLVREEIRPLLKSWLDTHLPSLVERVVRTEIERVIDRSGT
jgi:cell pole-organizing protein PopZ